MAKLDYERIAVLRSAGKTWPEIAAIAGGRAETLRGSYSRWARGESVRRAMQQVGMVKPRIARVEDSASVSVVLTMDQVERITSLEDLVKFFKVDLERYDVSRFNVNKWEQSSVAHGVVPLYQVTATLTPKATDGERAIEIAIRQAIADMDAHSPRAYAELCAELSAITPHGVMGGDPVSLTLHVNDPHLGMLAWGAETGESYDLKIAVDDYGRAFDHLLSFARVYNTEEILIVVGNDLLHADAPMPGAGGKGGATTKGTAQDMDTRLAKIFTAARRAVVKAIDSARLIPVARVVVQIVPGNHDRESCYKLGEVLAAWYRFDERVDVRFGPRKRSFYDYGANALMLTHGEEFQRQRDSLPLVFATECPPEVWARTTYREVLTGHNHRALAGRYRPTSDLDESRGIRVRSLPGLTATDSWHDEEGYKHHRAATAIAYKRSGGVAGLHEFTP